MTVTAQTMEVPPDSVMIHLKVILIGGNQMGRLTVLKQIAADLASQFGPDCEVVIQSENFGTGTFHRLHRKWSCYKQRYRRRTIQRCF